ncbi:DUF397 domain-containing protein [Micromonospora sp. NPDC002296]|uniref:DUF397 domain-containing protein n=1 Tax=Micromonospora sp. NPDC002296 TaxID=3154271 RepID=UPI003316A336
MDMTGAQWRKPSKSSTNGGACVEVSDNLVAAVYVRDTKDDGAGPVLAFSRESWGAFVAQLAERA